MDAYKIDLYFSAHILAVQVDRKGHQADKNEGNERKRFKKHLVCNFIRINSQEKDFDIFVDIGDISYT